MKQAARLFSATFVVAFTFALPYRSNAQMQRQ